MKNPLHKRYLRELKGDFTKYIMIFLFMVLFSGAVSGFLVTGSSIMHLYEKSHEELHLEDGHLAFNQVPSKQMLEEIEKANELTFYPLYYKEEKIVETNNTIRIYSNRHEVNLVSLYDGNLPTQNQEIALDRMYATNNHLKINDHITILEQNYKITGLIALPDYSALYENNTDMMFDSVNFGVAIVSEDGYEQMKSSHETYNYAWKYHKKLENDDKANEMSEKLTDSLKKIIQAYDEKIVQEQVNELYEKANQYTSELSTLMEEAGKQIETKMKEATSKAYIEYQHDPALDLDSLIAKELHLTIDTYHDLLKTLENVEKMMDEVDHTKMTPPQISFDDHELAYESEMNFEFDKLNDLISQMDSANLVDTKAIKSLFQQIKALQDFKVNEDDLYSLNDYLPEYLNQAIRFVGTDGKSDRATVQMMTYLINGIIAFLFAVTISNTITKESAVIGTLRASGYSRGELIRHYMVLPVLVSVVGCMLGNVLGYTIFVDLFKDVYYGSYSLPLFQPILNSDAFIQTTCIPLMLMVIINLWMLVTKLRITPLRLLRGELKKAKKRSRVIKLNEKIPFFIRFRLRILFQNIPAYLTLVFGIIIAGTLAVFGFMFIPLIQDYGELVEENMICEYQYVLMDQIETTNQEAEKFCLTTLETTKKDYLIDDVSIYGIEENSSYIDHHIQLDEVFITSALANKYNIKAGDEINLKEKYKEKYYTFKVNKICDNDGSIAIFMSRDQYLDTFNKKEDYFTGYFSNKLLLDLDQNHIATIIDANAMKKVTNQLNASFGSFMVVFQILGGGIFVLVMFILTKQIIEKNIKSISMTKILGFTNGEIGKLYLVITSFVVIGGLLISIPIINVLLRYIMQVYMYKRISGYIPYIVSNTCYLKTFVLGMVCYLVIAILMMIKIRKLPKQEVLKNQNL